jgi:anthranilate synthase component 1
MLSPESLEPTKATTFIELVRGRPEPRVRVPVVRTLPADLHTPVGAYLRLRALSSHNFLLESVEGGERLARYSFVGFEPRALVRAWGQRVEVEWRSGPTAGHIEQRSEDPRDTLRDLTGGAPLVDRPGLPRFLGGAVGFFSYDSVRLAERVPRTNPDELSTPDLDLGLHDALLAFDHLRSLLHLVRVVECPTDADDDTLLALHAAALADLDRYQRTLAAPLAPRPAPPPPGEPEFSSNFEQADFEAAVSIAKEHIVAGDIFQVVLSQRLSADIHCDPFAIYRSLRVLNPSPYLFFFELGAHTLVGASPEMLVRCESGHLQTLPIAGTRGRGATEEEDAALAEQLRTDPKERAEHEMLVDLGRNDIGRVSRFGSVRLAEHMELHRFSHVMHLVSRVTGELAEPHDALDALYSCFPAGTVSGAPKVRAMQIVEALEPTARGVYAGAVGYLDYRGDLDTCIAIRTVVVHRQRAHVQAGAGIVYDSDPTAEWDETRRKAAALLQAVRWAELGVLEGAP